MFGRKIRVDRELYDKLRMHAETAGYSSVEEFVAHVLEQELARREEADADEDIRKRLKGLGYIS